MSGATSFEDTSQLPLTPSFGCCPISYSRKGPATHPPTPSTLSLLGLPCISLACMVLLRGLLCDGLLSWATSATTGGWVGGIDHWIPSETKPMGEARMKNGGQNQGSIRCVVIYKLMVGNSGPSALIKGWFVRGGSCTFGYKEGGGGGKA